MTFEEWWSSVWKNPYGIDVLNDAIKVIAKAAWDASAKNSFPTCDQAFKKAVDKNVFEKC